MHPAVIVIPALALIFGPRLWVGRVLKQNNRRDLPSKHSARTLARELLDNNGLHSVRVERTDIGDHYDPEVKAVRLSADKIDRKTLTALTTAAHEVAHALQDAAAYGPFVWRTRLFKVAQRASEAGMVLFVAVPLSAIVSRRPFPPLAIAAAALVVLGTGVVAQLAALPSELDASFKRALPMLRDGYLDENQARAACEILWACSLTYVASSLIAVVQIWPWVAPVPVRPAGATACPVNSVPAARRSEPFRGRAKPSPTSITETARRRKNSLLAAIIRPIGKPIVRTWLRAAQAISESRS